MNEITIKDLYMINDSWDRNTFLDIYYINRELYKVTTYKDLTDKELNLEIITFEENNITVRLKN